MNKLRLNLHHQTQLLNSCFSGGSSSSDPGTYVTGGTANGTNDTLVFTNSTGGTFTVANSALLFNDAFVSGGTLDTTTGCVTFKNTSGGTFQVCGFDGFTSNIKYIPDRINPQQAYDLYKEGPGSGGVLGGANKYKVRVALLEDNNETSSWEI